jgi:hypothetical protein
VFQSLGVCLQAIAQLVQQLGHQTVADAVTTTPNSWASLRRLLQVQRSADSGSPRLSGSINRSKSLTSVASCSTVLLLEALRDFWSANVKKLSEDAGPEAAKFTVHNLKSLFRATHLDKR